MALVKLHVKKGDSVLVLSGKDKGKQGKIIAAMPKVGKVLVEGVNKVKRHSKPGIKVPNGGIMWYRYCDSCGVHGWFQCDQSDFAKFVKVMCREEGSSRFCVEILK